MAKRSKMVACRLSEVEYSQLMDLLNIDESSQQDFFSNKFRSLLRILDGRLYLDNFGSLRLRPTEGEISKELQDKFEKASKIDLYDMVLS